MQRITENSDLATNEDYVLVTFTTNSTVSQVASSPMRKVANYGYFPHGEQIYVHKDDQKRLPRRYVLVKKKAPTRAKRRTKKAAE